jgi:polar amino acid transport system substrate-binding protein
MTTMLRRKLFALTLGAVALLGGCASAPTVDQVVKAALAPTGTLRVGVYAGSPTSLVRDAKTGESAGVALNLGQALGKQLGVPVQVVEFARLALVLDAVKAGAVDFTFTNATEVRARDMDFSDTLIQLELGFLVPPKSTLAKAADVDVAGIRVGVAQGSSSQGALGRVFKNAAVVPAPSLAQAQQMLLRGELDAFATNKGILFEMSEGVPGARVLDGRWGTESMAMAIPKGRAAAMPYLLQFASDVRANGLLASIVRKAGLRGTVQSE